MLVPVTSGHTIFRWDRALLHLDVPGDHAAEDDHFRIVENLQSYERAICEALSSMQLAVDSEQNT